MAVKNIIFYGLEILLLCFAQGGFLPYALPAWAAVPNIILILTILLAIKERIDLGFFVLSGLIASILYPFSPIITMSLYFAIGVIVFGIMDLTRDNNIAVYFIQIFIGSFIFGIFSFLSKVLIFKEQFRILGLLNWQGLVADLITAALFYWLWEIAHRKE